MKLFMSKPLIASFYQIHKRHFCYTWMTFINIWHNCSCLQVFFLSLHSTWFSSYFSENLCLIFIITLHFSLTSIQCSYFIWSLSPLHFFFFIIFLDELLLVLWWHRYIYIYHIHIFDLFYQASFTYSRTYLIASLKYLINT